jgi:acyl transferase domain-containing protein
VTAAADIAITGMGVLTPVADGPAAFTRTLRGGRTGFRRAETGEIGSLLTGFRLRDWVRPHTAGSSAARARPRWCWNGPATPEAARPPSSRGSAGTASAWTDGGDTEPDPAGQARAMSQALARADLTPADVDYVNAHATGSVVGDQSEAAALLTAFGPGRRPLVNSTKALIGHCLSAGGLLELIATVLQMRDGFVHANPNLAHSVEPRLALAGRTAATAPMRVALSNSFAFGGISASVVLTGSPAQ